MSRLFIVIGCVIAAVLIADSVMHDPDVHPFVSNVIQHVDQKVDSWQGSLGAKVGANERLVTCHTVDAEWTGLEIELPRRNAKVGDVIAGSNSDLTVLVIVQNVTPSGRIRQVDLLGSLPVTGAVLGNGDEREFVEIDPPARAVQSVRTEKRSPFRDMQVCYIGEEPVTVASPIAVPSESQNASPDETVTIEPPSTSGPTETPEPTITSTVEPTQTPEPSATSTVEWTATTVPTETAEPTLTNTVAPTATTVPTETAEPTLTNTVAPTATTSPTETPKPTQTNTIEPTATTAPTETLEPTQTNTVAPTATTAPTETLEPTLTNTVAPTATTAPTETVEPTQTNTVEPTVTTAPTETPEPTQTNTVEPTVTTAPTETPEPTLTNTVAPTATTALTETAEPTMTNTVAPTETAAPTSTVAVATTSSVIEGSPEATGMPGSPVVQPASPESGSPASVDASPTATPLYSTSGTASFVDWTVPEGWSASGVLVTSGEQESAEWVAPPVTVTTTNDYGVEFTFTLAETDVCPRSFGVAIRGSSEGYIAGGIEWNCDAAAQIWIGQERVASTEITLSEGPHVMRLEAIGPQITLLVDGTVVAEFTAESVQVGSIVAFWSTGVPVAIESVQIIDLSSQPGGENDE